jgi:hypothetical protein
MNTYKLSECGKALVKSFVNHVAAMPELHKMSYWYLKAENTANDAMPWEPVVLEMPGKLTASGTKQSITIYRELFDLEVPNEIK